MAMSVDHDQDVGFMWENQPWCDLLINYENLGDNSKPKLDMKLVNQKAEIIEGEALQNKKRKRGGAPKIRSENNITNGEGGKYRDSDHEMHILSERERRKKLRNMFDSLHALLPQLPTKVDKATIVEEAVKHIKSLQQVLEELQKKKQEKLKSVSPFGSDSSSVINNSQWNPYESKEITLADQGSSSYINNLPTNAIVASNPSNELSLSAPPPQQVVFKTWTSSNVVLNICGGEAQFCICATKKPGVMTTIAVVLEKHRIDVVSANISCNGTGKFYMIMGHAKQGSQEDANSLEEIYKQAALDIMKWIA